MSDIKLFQINNNKVTELEGKSVIIEKTLQTIPLALRLCKSKIPFSGEKCWDEVGLSHHCLGNLEIRIKSAEDLEKSKPFILKKYEMS
ncbi:MAG: hypothetical protein WAV89_15400 [Ignavibacteriaceae bacterium]